MTEAARYSINYGRLVGYDALCRIRIGDYRVIYTIRDAELIVRALRIAHRREAYRKS